MRNDLLIVFPAKSGSKRVTNKNIRLIRGEPLLERLIFLAKEAALTEHICVDTDSKGYAELPLKSGARCFFSGNSFGDDYWPVTTHSEITRMSQSRWQSTATDHNEIDGPQLFADIAKYKRCASIFR